MSNIFYLSFNQILLLLLNLLKSFYTNTIKPFSTLTNSRLVSIFEIYTLKEFTITKYL